MAAKKNTPAPKKPAPAKNKGKGDKKKLPKPVLRVD